MNATAIFCVVFGVQACGLISVVTARLAVGSPRQTCCQCFFYACLAVVGVTSILAVGLGTSCWAYCAVTLPLMVLGATLDPSGAACKGTF